MKLLATDMDGTFLRDDKSYSEEFNDLYKQMLKQDIQFVIASGNQYEALACKFDEEIKNDLYYLCENGTKIVYQGKTLYKEVFRKTRCSRSSRYFKRRSRMYACCFWR